MLCGNKSLSACDSWPNIFRVFFSMGSLTHWYVKLVQKDVGKHLTDVTKWNPNLKFSLLLLKTHTGVICNVFEGADKQSLPTLGANYVVFVFSYLHLELSLPFAKEKAIHTLLPDITRFQEPAPGKIHFPKPATTSKVPPASILRAFATSTRGLWLHPRSKCNHPPPPSLLCRWFSVILSVTGRDARPWVGLMTPELQVG